MRPEKQLLLDEINDLMDHSSAMFVTRYDRLTPETSWTLAEDLSKCKSYFKVIKKRLLYKAAQKRELPFKDNKINGHVAIVFVQGDPLEASRVLVKFQSNNVELLEIVSGQIEGRLCSSEEIVTLSKLPGKNELRAELLGLFEAPMAQTLSVMENLLSSIPFCLENKKEELSK
jgi:large subunit ribosomal protein L10